jgi:hypothetical protein
VLEERAAQIRRTFVAGRTLASFYEAYRGAKIELPVKRPAKIAEGVEKEIRDVTLADFAESLLGEGAAASWPTFLARLRAACDAPPGDGAGAVRIPVGNLLPATVQLQLWLAWLEAEGAFGRRSPSGVLVCRPGPVAGRPLLPGAAPEDFLLLHPERSDHEFVEEAVPARTEAAPGAGETRKLPRPGSARAAGTGR